MTVNASAPRLDDRPRLLVLEDDDAIADQLAEGPEREGFQVERPAPAPPRWPPRPPTWCCSTSGSPTPRAPRCAGPCAAARRCRSSSSPPGATSSTGVLLLELGADDHVVEPFGFRELVARIRAVRRRAAAAPGDLPGAPGRPCGSWDRSPSTAAPGARA